MRQTRQDDGQRNDLRGIRNLLHAEDATLAQEFRDFLESNLQLVRCLQVPVQSQRQNVLTLTTGVTGISRGVQRHRG